MPPMIGVDHRAFERHADKGRGQRGADAVAAPVSDHLAQAETDREQDQRDIERAADPAGVEVHVEIDLVHVLVMVAAGEFERADTERMGDDQPRGLLLTAEATRGAHVIVLLESRALFHQL